MASTTSRIQKKAATAALADAWSVPVVTDVRDHIDVRYPGAVILPTDDEIHRHVLNELARSPAISISDVDVQVNAGRVTLSGSIDSHQKKANAEVQVAVCLSVISIDNKLAIVPDRDIVDQGIANDIVAAIDRNMLVKVDDMTVRVRDGFVTLSGAVPTYAARRAAYEATLYAATERAVSNNIVVRAATPSYV